MSIRWGSVLALVALLAFGSFRPHTALAPIQPVPAKASVLVKPEREAATACIAKQAHTAPLSLAKHDAWGKKVVEFRFCRAQPEDGRADLKIEEVLSIDYIAVYDNDESVLTEVIGPDDPDFTVWTERFHRMVKEFADVQKAESKSKHVSIALPGSDRKSDLAVFSSLKKTGN